MRDFFKSKVFTVVILLATLILAGIAIFTAIRLYQLRQEAVAPTAPTSKPAAAEPPKACTVMSFTIGSPSPSPSPSGTATPTATPTGSPTATPTGTATATATATGTGTAAPSLPSAGTSWPTIVGIGVGILVIVGSILLAL